MRKVNISLLLAFLAIQILSAHEYNDSSTVVNLKEISIAAYKETNNQNTPLSATLLKGEKIELSQIQSIKNLNGIVPNFYVPNYGSAISSAVYIRGLGSRNSGQSMSLYIDDHPYMDKSAFDFELYDISQIEVLRGSQGTLYGRNSLGGVVNIHTVSPLTYQGTKLMLKGGKYQTLNTKIAHYTKPISTLGIAVLGYYNYEGGFLVNQFNNQSADKKKSAGGRIKTVWLPNENYKMTYIANADYVSQGAFPYGLYDVQKKQTQAPNYNDDGSYKRWIVNNQLLSQLTSDNILFNLALSHQYLSDDMHMDQDYTPRSMFEIEQQQRQNMFNGEISLKSNNPNDYQWSIGINAFLQRMSINVPVSFKQDALKIMFAPMLQSMGMKILSPIYLINGDFKNNIAGISLFHQSTLDNFLIDGLSLTAGIRVDAESNSLDYNTNASMEIERANKTIPMYDEMVGVSNKKSIQINPKLAFKYEWDKTDYAYISVSRGHKAGGFNIQMIADLMNQKLLGGKNPNTKSIQIDRDATFEPEISWNYEFGYYNAMFDKRARLFLTAFYMDVRGLQLTQFVASGTGRKLTNAGVVTSKGLEASLDYKLSTDWSMGISYGLADARFEKYSKIVGKKEIDYKGNTVPYAPKNTLGVNLHYDNLLQQHFLDRIYAMFNYNGVGRIYWNESNDMELSQNFYSLLDAVVGVEKGIYSIELWGKNLLNTHYNTFYFQSFGKQFFQVGKPLQFGATLKLDL